MALSRHASRLARAALFATLLGLSSGAAAQWQDPQGTPLPDDTARGDQNGFAGQVLLADVDEVRRFQDEWYNTDPEHAPNITLASTARRGDSVELLMLFANCAPPGADDAAIARGEVPCNATYDIVLVRPDGTPYPGSVSTGLPLAGERALAGRSGYLQLAPSSIRVHFEPEDPPGEYRFDVRFRNPARDADFTVSTAITLVDAAP